jgi:hypothetical protein
MIEENYKTLSKMKNEMKGYETELKKIITEIRTSTNKTIGYWNQMTTRVNKIYEEMRGTFGTYFNKMVDSEYYSSLHDQIIKIKKMKFSANKKINYSDIEGAHVHKQSVNAILMDGLNNFFIGTETGQKTLNKLMMNTQQILTTESEINRTIDAALQQRRDPFTVKKRLMEKMGEILEEGKFVTVINKNGQPMNFKLDYYSELVARTKLIEANCISAVNTAIETGSDLVQVSSHNTPTPLCQEYEGKIYSISGQDKDFPVLEEIPPYHPNCQHSLTVVFREVLEDRGIQKYIDYSNGTTEEHPTRRAHIPVSKR